MENASKALLMAGGVLMAILVISLLVLMFASINGYFTEADQANKESQIVKFNLEYESYNKEDVRGTEILSLLAKVNDYNTKQSDYEGTSAGYNPISVIVNIGNNNLKVFKFNESDKQAIDSKYEESKNVHQYADLLNIKTTCINKLSEIIQQKNGELYKNGARVTETNLETLAGALTNLTSDTANELELQKRYDLLKRIFLVDGETIWNQYNNTILQYTEQYYQYTQFKKAHFDCKEVSYKDSTGKDTERITKLIFEFNGTIE